MNQLSTRRVNFCPEADARLKRLKGLTGLTPNIICRVGFCLSLEEPAVPDPEHYPPGSRDINRYTLTGEFDDLMVALLTQRLFEDELDWGEHAENQFAAHMNRGALLVSARVRSLPDLLALSRA